VHCEYGGMPLMCFWSNISGHMRSRMSVRPSYLYLLGLSGRFSYRFKKIYISVVIFCRVSVPFVHSSVANVT